jgi:hypothetical protein
MLTGEQSQINEPGLAPHPHQKLTQRGVELGMNQVHAQRLKAAHSGILLQYVLNCVSGHSNQHGSKEP